MSLSCGIGVETWLRISRKGTGEDHTIIIITIITFDERELVPWEIMDAMRITVWAVGRDLGLAGCHFWLRTYVFSFSCLGTSTYFVKLVQVCLSFFLLFL